MKKRKWRPSGRNCGQRWLPWPGRKPRHGHGRPTRGHHAHQQADTDNGRRGEHEDAVAVPRAAAATRRVRQHLRAAASQIDPLQLAVGKKSNRAAIRRPERIARAFGARERLRRHLVERPHPEPRRTLGRRDERQLPAVGRQRERDRIARRRRRDFKARRKWLGYHATEVQRGGDCQRRCEQRARAPRRSTRSATRPCCGCCGRRLWQFPPCRRRSALQSERARLRSPEAASSDPSFHIGAVIHARRGGVAAGSAVQSGFALDNLRKHVRDRLAVEGRAAGQHLVEHDAERPDVRALVGGPPRACSGLMYAAVPRMIPACVIAGVVIVG